MLIPCSVVTLPLSPSLPHPELEAYQQQGGDPPRCDVTLCFGEELVTTDDQSQKLILVKVRLSRQPHLFLFSPGRFKGDLNVSRSLSLHGQGHVREGPSEART